MKELQTPSIIPLKPELAARYGVAIASILATLVALTLGASEGEEEGLYEVNGEVTWVRISTQDWLRLLPWITSKATIIGHLRSAEDLGLISSSQLKMREMDSTKWYALSSFPLEVK